MTLRTTDRSGFTLIELVIVVVVIGILITVVLNTGQRVFEDARTEETKQEMDALAHAIVGYPELQNVGNRAEFGYVGDVGAFPPDLNALQTNPGSYTTWRGPYVSDRFEQISGDYQTDAWGNSYSYSGLTISSSGSGSSIVRRLGGNVSDFTLNSVSGVVLDQDATPPGVDYRDSVAIRLIHPNGTGNYRVRTTSTDAGGFFEFDSVPVGNHDLDIVYLPTGDTITTYVTVLPSSRTNGQYQLAENFWQDTTSTGGGSLPTPLAHYMFDESSGTTATDATGNGYHGTLYNMDPATDWVPGQIDGSLDFDGNNDYVSTGLAANAVTDLTISVWFNSDDGASVGNNYVAQRFLSQPRSAAYSRIAFGINSGRVSAFWYDGWYQVGEGNTTLSANTWYHAALTYDGADIRIYLNGVENGSFSESSLSSPSNDTFQIGQQISGERRYDGQLDDVRIYDRALTDSEILAIYNAGL